MLEDIKSGKDGVAFVLVFKLSRFGRNAADVLATLQTMQDFGVNLICVEDGIDSSTQKNILEISIRLLQREMLYILVQIFPRNILDRNIQTVLREQMQRQKQMLQPEFLK